MKTPLKLSLIAAVLAAAGCATLSPEAGRQLEEARASYRSASEDPRVQRYAAAELASASSALREAERLAAEGGATELVEHNAYLAERRSRTALGTAQIRQAEADIAAAREERRRTQLEAREREAAAARARAEQAEIAAARARAEQAEVARREAEQRAQLLQKEKTSSLFTSELAAEVKRLETELADVRAKQTERGWILTLKNELLFDSGGATLKPGGQRALDNLAQFLRKHAERDIAIEGFTDAIGSPDSNQRLSERRAQAVKDALVGRGVESRRIDARGYGPSFPVASNATETGRQLNRRVEIVINPS